MKQNNWEIYFLELIKDKHTGFFAGVCKFFLRVFSWLYQLLVSIRNYAFDKGWLRKYSPPVPLVVSIGNIVAGGTGKTPVTLMLAREFTSDFHVAILSRGYRSRAESLPSPICLSKGDGPMHPAEFCGDEPYLLAENLPKAYVFVGKNRHKASNMAAKAGAQLILLDDGMQHRRLARDLEVVVLDAGDPFGQGYFLPRGFLREGRKSLSRANLIILNHVKDNKQFAEMKEQVAPYSKAPIVGTQMKVSGIFDFDGSKVESLGGVHVGLFCGIARPEYFEKTVLGEGAVIVDRHIVPDHKTFHHEELAEFAEACKNAGAKMLVCTEKDKVKFAKKLQLPLPTAWLRIDLSVVEGSSEWQVFVEKAKTILKKRI